VTQPAPPEGLDPRIVKALSHPLRYQVLVRLNHGDASPVEIARELRQPIGRVSHHVKTLVELGAIELVRTVPRRGAVEHFYRAAIPAWFSDADWARIPPSAREAISAQNLQQVLQDVTTAAPDHAFGHPKAYLSRQPLVLDEQAMGEISELLSETLDRATEIEAASVRRLREQIGRTQRATTLVMLHFERQAEEERRR
jgi:DNA-binding transcriptional ArsR family regulator